MGKHMNESRSRIAVRRLLLKILKDDRTPVLLNQTAYRRSLKGGLEARTRCIRLANEYLSLLKITPVHPRALPVSLNRTVAECRKVAGSIRLSCTARMEAIEKLLYLEGLEVPQTASPTWALIHRELGTSAPEPEVSSHDPQYLIGKRAVNRKRALDEVRRNYLQDAADGRLAGLTHEQIAQALRLDGMEPVDMPEDAPVIEKEKLTAAIAAFRRAG